MDNHLAVHADGVEVGFRELLIEAWVARWVVVTVTLICTLAGVTAGLVMHKQYRAEILMTSPDSLGGGGGGMGAIASQYGALASLAGVSTSGKGAKDEAIAVLQSRLITEAYVRDNNVLPVLYADRWDAQTKRWKSKDEGDIPSLWMANQFFSKKIREVKEDKQSGLVTMRITWRDPLLAAKWANELVRDTNQYLRDKAIKESDRNIAYLNDQAAKTNALEVRTAIYSLLKDELNKQMIARGREEYALKVLDPAQPPEAPSSPSATLLGAGGTAAGLILSGLLVWRRLPSL